MHHFVYFVSFYMLPQNVGRGFFTVAEAWEVDFLPNQYIFCILSRNYKENLSESRHVKM